MAVCRQAGEDRGLAGGIDGTLIAYKLGQWNAEQGAVRREFPVRAAEMSWKAAGRLAAGHCGHRERAVTSRLAPI